MRFVYEPKISTKRLVLREILESDFDSLIDIFCNEEVKRTYILPDLSSREEGISLAKRVKDLSNNYDRFVYAICLDNRLIGLVNDVFIDENTIELGYVIHPNYKNNGYATESLRACIELIFRSGFSVVRAGAFEENFASIRVMEKCGLTITPNKEQIDYRGKIHNCKYYQISKV